MINSRFDDRRTNLFVGVHRFVGIHHIAVCHIAVGRFIVSHRVSVFRFHISVGRRHIGIDRRHIRVARYVGRRVAAGFISAVGSVHIVVGRTTAASHTERADRQNC